MKGYSEAFFFIISLSFGKMINYKTNENKCIKLKNSVLYKIFNSPS